MEAAVGISTLDDGSGHGEWGGVHWTITNYWEEL